jgi:DNA-binding NarL/FixJ family response regulator
MVLDLNVPGRDGFEVLHEVRRERLALKVLVLSLHGDSAYVARAVREGADGYVLKENAVQELPAAIRAVLAGQGHYSPRVQAALSEMVRSGERDPLDRLSAREREVIRRVAEGKSSKEIASELNLSVRTIESHRATLMRKLELRSVAELTRFAVESGLLRRP